MKGQEFKKIVKLQLSGYLKFKFNKSVMKAK